MPPKLLNCAGRATTRTTACDRGNENDAVQSDIKGNALVSNLSALNTSRENGKSRILLERIPNAIRP